MDILNYMTLLVSCLLSLMPRDSSAVIGYGEALTPFELNITRQLIDAIDIPSDSSSLRQRRCRLSGTRTSVSDTASCPWYYTARADDNRYPKKISNATLKACNNTRYCLHYLPSGRSTINRAGVCTELMATFPVLRYVTDITGLVTTELSSETVAVGYTCQRIPISNSNMFPVSG